MPTVYGLGPESDMTRALEQYVEGMTRGDHAQIMSSLAPDVSLEVAVHPQPILKRSQIDYLFEILTHVRRI